MDKLDIALKILKEDNWSNQSIINFIENNPIFSVEIVNKAVLVRGVSDQAWVYIAGENRDDVKELIEKKVSKEDKFFASIDEWMVPYIIAGRRAIWNICTVRYILPDSVDIPTPMHNTVPLDPKDARIIYPKSIYSQYIDENYIKDRIYKGFSAGIYEDNGEPIGWVFTQDDGAIAFLHVKNEYRRRGYAKSLVLSLMRKIRNSGKRPFMYIEDRNVETIKLAKKLGFEPDRVVYWLHIQ